MVLANVVYQACSKGVPADMNAFASLTVTYAVAALACLGFFCLLGGAGGGASILQEYRKLNWAPFALGVVVVGLEVGWIFAYQAGWEVSKGFIVQSALVAIGLIALGYFGYHEAVTWNKLLGVVICLVGLAFINMK